MSKDLGIILLAIAIIAVGILSYVKDPVQVNVSDGSVSVTDGKVGGFPGPDVYNRMMFHSGVSEGGVYAVATSGPTYTMDAVAMSNSKIIDIPPANVPALALTTMASSTWVGLDSAGDSQSWIIDNRHTAAATTTTITAGTGVDIDGDGANDDVINGGVSGWLTCWRLPDTDIRCYVVEGVDAG